MSKFRAERRALLSDVKAYVECCTMFLKEIDSHYSGIDRLSFEHYYLSGCKELIYAMETGQFPSKQSNLNRDDAQNILQMVDDFASTENSGLDLSQISHLTDFVQKRVIRLKAEDIVCGDLQVEIESVH